MGLVRDLGRKAWRKYDIDGVSSSGVNEPDTVDIFPFVDAIDAGIQEAKDIASTDAKPKDPVRITLTASVAYGSITAGSTHQGITLASGDRVAVIASSNAALNGILAVQSSGPAIRSSDADTAEELVGSSFFTMEGTQAGNRFRLSTPRPITLGTTPLNFTLESSQGSLNPIIASKADQSALDTVSTVLQTEVSNRQALVRPDGTGSADEDPAFPFQDAVGFFNTYITRSGALRSGSGTLDVSGLRVFRDDYSGFAVTDPIGFIVMAADGNGTIIGGETSGGSEGGSPSVMPYFAPNLCGAEGVPQSIHMAGLIDDRANIPLTRMTLCGASGTTVSGEDEITFRTDDLGDTASLVVRPRDWQGGNRAVLPLQVKTAPVPAVAPTLKRILIIGDSISNRQAALFLNQHLTAWGYIVSFIGTMPGMGPANNSADETGPMGEAREGWEGGDFTFAITDRAIPIDAGDEASYLALPKGNKRDYNPFIRVATGGDSPSIVRNGYVLDFDFYQSRFGFQEPDIVFNGTGTNDVRDREASEIYSTVLANDTLMHSRMRAAWPSAKILRTVPGTARDPVRDALWSDEYIPMIRAMMDAKASLSDANIHIVPAWAMVTADAGYTLLSSTPDPTTGAIITSTDDSIHPVEGARAALWRSIAAYVACACAGQI